MCVEGRKAVAGVLWRTGMRLALWFGGEEGVMKIFN